MSTVDFVHLHNHTEYSLLDGACRCGDMCARAAEFGMPAVAMTDHGAMFATIEFYKAAKEAGVKPLIGCELYMAPGSRTVREGGERGSNNHLLVLAKDDEGYNNLIKLCSLAYSSGFYYKPRIDWELLEEYHKGLVISSACLKGVVAQAIVDEQPERACRFIERMTDLVGRENFFLEVMDHGMPEQRKANAGIFDLAKRYDLKVIATNDTHYLEQKHWEMHDVLLCIGTGKRMADENRMRYEPHEFHFKSPEEMAHIFRDHPEALSNTLLVAEMCDASVPLASGDSDNSKFPKFEPPESKTPEDYLRELTLEGLERRYRDRLSDVHRRQAEVELDVIGKTGFADYFLIVWDFINYAKEQSIPVGPGRGSGAGSIVAYSLGITDLDPIEHKLIFERFLNIERLEPPDFDIDFCTDRRQEVVEYVRRKYGPNNVCNIVTFGSLKAKNALRDVGRVMDLPLDRVNQVCALVPGDLGITIDGALKQSDGLRAQYEADSEVHRMIDLARQVEGLHRNCGVHAAGVIITDRPVSDFAPVFNPGGNSGELVSQFAMSEVTASGLLKMDFLGLKNLTVIHNACRLIERNHGVTIDWDRIPREDPKTYEFLRTAQMTGVFQLESSGMRDLIRKLGPTCFADVAAIIALFRPGPMNNIDLFVSSKKNPETVSYPHPMLEEILSETYGVIVYQEQVMQIAQKMGGFSMGQADKLRKAMGKKKLDVMAEQKVHFIEGAGKNGVDEAAATRVWDLMAKFAEYGFNKAHTVSYAEVAFRTAYLKAHYRVEFMAALMTNDMGDVDKMAGLFSEAREMGIRILPPDINESLEMFTVVDGDIRFGLGGIKNVGLGAVREVIKDREANGHFTSFQEFCERTLNKGVNTRMIECLIRVGAFDQLHPNRASLFAAKEDVARQAQITIRERETGQMSLFGEAEGGAMNELIEAPLPRVPDWSIKEKLAYEKELTGFFITGHPLDELAVDMRSFAQADSGSFADLRPDQQTRLVGQIGEVRRTRTKNGDDMAFCQLEDFHGAVELVVFPRSFVELEPYLVTGAMVVVTGRVNERNGARSLIVDKIMDATQARSRLAKFLDLALPVGSINAENMGRLKQALLRFEGKTRVRFFVETGNGPVAVEADKRLMVTPSNELLEDIESLPFSKSLRFSEN